MATPAAAVNAAAQEDCTCVVFGTAAATCAAVGRFADDIADAAPVVDHVVKDDCRATMAASLALCTAVAEGSALTVVWTAATAVDVASPD